MFKKRIVAALTTALMIASPVAAQAQAQTGSSQSVGSSSFDSVLGQTRENVWQARNSFLAQISQLNPQAATQLRPALDAAIDLTFPGLRAQKEREDRERLAAIEQARQAEVAAQRARAEEAARKAEAERQRQQFNVGPCPADAAVCVDINGRRTWLQSGGKVTYVAPSMAPGRPGNETPRGTFTVLRKVKDEVSYEFNNAPMPYAVYFTNYGHAFHQGNPAYDSSGCVRLPNQAAIRYWDHLKMGDKVFIY
ncbi:MAG: L,D-transpeptidase [Corynebacterium sp.]|nr:L,D-transpeptidase [Corynebacterium sp.]